MTRSAATAGGPRSGGPRLAFDLSTSMGSVALARAGEPPRIRELPDAKAQAARLVPMIAELLEEAGLAPSDLERIVVGKGPGSFTGVRIAAATARGMSAGLGIPVWPISSLEAAAVSGPDHGLLPGAADGGGPRYVLFDAGGDRLYAAAYRVGAGAIETLLDPSATTLPELLSREIFPGELRRGALFSGDGALAHAAAIEAAGHIVLPPPAGVPTADALLFVHGLRAEDPPEPPGSRWEPAYLRGSSARPMATAPDPATAGGTASDRAGR